MGKWIAATKGSTKMRGKMRGLLGHGEIKYRDPDKGKRVVKKEIISEKTGKPIKSAGPGRLVRLRYTYEDGTTYETVGIRLTKAESALFKATATGEAHAHDPREMASDEDREVVFSNCLDVPRGGKIDTVRAAIAALLGRWQLPKEGKFEVLIYWKIFEDQLKEKVLDAPPSKRFTVDAKVLSAGYGKFLDSMLEMKSRDLEDALDMDLDEIMEEMPDVVKAWKKGLKQGKDIPTNVTRAFIEKQMLAMAQGRGVYMSDKSYFKDFNESKKGKKGKKSKTHNKETAEMSEVCVKVWKLEEKKRAKSKPKAKGKKRGKS